MKINKSLYGAVSSNALMSPVTALVSDVNDQCDELLASVTTSPVGIQSPDTVTAVTDAVTGLQGQLTGFSDHVDLQLDDALHNASLSKLARKIDSAVNEVPESCAVLDGVMGTITGAGEVLVNAASEKLAALVDMVDGYPANGVDLSDINASVSDLAASGQSLADKVEEEIAALKALIKTIDDWADTIRLEELSTDPCARSLLNKILPTDIKSHLPELSL